MCSSDLVAQLRCDLEPRESMRVLSDRGRVERGAATFAEDEARISSDEKVARDDQADDEGEDAIDEADRLAGHPRVNCNARDKRSARARYCAAFGPLQIGASELTFSAPLLASEQPLLVCVLLDDPLHVAASATAFGSIRGRSAQSHTAPTFNGDVETGARSASRSEEGFR